MSRGRKSKDEVPYYQRISLNSRIPEEAERITSLFNDNINMAYKVASKYYKTRILGI